MTLTPGEKLTKQKVFELIWAKVNAAWANDTNEYQQLCDIFDACYGFRPDINLEYLPSLGQFNVFDTDDLNVAKK